MLVKLSPSTRSRCQYWPPTGAVSLGRRLANEKTVKTYKQRPERWEKSMNKFLRVFAQFHVPTNVRTLKCSANNVSNYYSICAITCSGFLSKSKQKHQFEETFLPCTQCQEHGHHCEEIERAFVAVYKWTVDGLAAIANRALEMRKLEIPFFIIFQILLLLQQTFFSSFFLISVFSRWVSKVEETRRKALHRRVQVDRDRK